VCQNPSRAKHPFHTGPEIEFGDNGLDIRTEDVDLHSECKLSQ